jgi:hypothetical protein
MSLILTLPKWLIETTYWQRLDCLHSATMADAEEDFSSLPLPDRFAHKVRILCEPLVPLSSLTDWCPIA